MTSDTGFLYLTTLILNFEPFKENIVTINYDNDAENNNIKNDHCS